MTKTEKREAAILERLQSVGKLSIKELSEMFSISAPTARRISASLAENNKVVRTHGGIRYLPHSEFEYSFDTFKNQHAEEKGRIAQYVSSLIKDGDVIFLEAGTTVQQLALALADRIRENRLNNVNIFTNSLNNLNILSPLCRVTVIGGEYRPKRKDFSGYVSEKTLKLLSFKYCFLGADAINFTEGIMAADVETVRFDELLLHRSEKSYILADSSKFNLRSFVSYASIYEVSKIVTDSNLEQSIKNEYLNNRIDLVCI